jgi:hypothetical protein
MKVTLDDETIEKIARRIVELQGLVSPGPVLTLQQAMEFVAKRSRESFRVWVRRFAPNARCGDGRYTRAALAKGREVEARQFAPTRKRRLS